jgi:hypothetical protein
MTKKNQKSIVVSYLNKSKKKKNSMVWYEVDSSGSRYGPMEGSCESGN